MAGSVSNLSGFAGLLFILGIVVAVLGAVVLVWLRGKGKVPGGAMVIVGLVAIVGSVGIGALAPAAVTTPPATPAVSCAVQLASSPALVTGETFNTVTNTLTVDLVYNKTSNYFAVQASVANTFNKPNYVVFPLKLVRLDTVNQTFSFPMSVASIPTAASLGATPTVYSVVGYTTATSTSPGIWQLFFDKGVLANQKPTVAAPTVSTNVISDGVPVPSFNSVTSAIHISLAGGNSTSAPYAFAAALQNFTAYPLTIGIGQGTPSVMTINFIVIGWNA